MGTQDQTVPLRCDSVSQYGRIMGCEVGYEHRRDTKNTRVASACLELRDGRRDTTDNRGCATHEVSLR